ncbi:MAG: NAD(P)-binding protein [Gammaproteobacteria bacterium]|nr:NAD(P)-binding protein [Gammaproteobacteria bacterium]
MSFSQLLSPFTIRQTTFRNRIFSTGHMTRMTKNGLPTEQMIAYHEARAKGGAGLIILEAARVHDSALSDSPAVDASTDRCIPSYASISKAIHSYGCRVFGQISHSGRANDRRRGGLRDVPYSASATPDERFHNMPRSMSEVMISDIVSSYATAAKRMATAGLDGVEIPASHGLLPAQFLNPRVNIRSDKYGGSLINRLRFLIDIIHAVRNEVGETLALGVRISLDEMEHHGLDTEETVKICTQLDSLAELDYLNITAGSMAGLGGSVHVVPPMMIEHGYTAPLAARIKKLINKPIFVAGRINQPQIAEQILSSGHADMCGMTRALISDPDMPYKVMNDQLEDIRACIGCNQACIGHYHLGTSISCIQFPTTGRELALSILPTLSTRKRVAVIGGGPAGLKASITAAQRGHDVTLLEANSRLGGQVNLAQLLPGRGEFGGLITNLEREAKNAGVSIHLNSKIDKQWLEDNTPDTVIAATGATPYQPDIPGAEDAHVIDSWDLLRKKEKPGVNVLIADWRSDWIGLGVAEYLARNGSSVTLAVNGMHAGQEVQSYTRDQWIGTLHKLGVKILPYMRLYGVDAQSVYLQHTLSNEPVICEDIHTLVLALGHQSNTGLEVILNDLQLEYYLAGDNLSPRSAEEAVYEGMMAGMRA